MFTFLLTAFPVCYYPFSIAVRKWNASLKSYEQRKTDVIFWPFGKLYIYVCMYMKITGWRSKTKDRVLRFTHNRFRWCCFSSVYKGYHFVLLIWRCLGIKYGDDAISRTRYFRRFCDLSLYIEQKFEFIYEIIFIRYS